MNKNYKKQGYWDNEPIWRELTPQEKLERDIKVKPELAAFALLWLGSKHLSKITKI